MTNLTDIEIKKAKARDKPWKLTDGGGLYLLVNPNGSKWWRYKYSFTGREKLLALGVYPDTGLKEARVAHEVARRQLAGGVDPAAARKAEKSAQKAMALNTFEAVARAWLAHRAPAWKAGTFDAIQASLETHVFPRLGNRPVAEIQPGDVREAVKAVEATGASETAGRVFQRIRAVYRHAIAHELVASDPTYPLKPAEILMPRKITHRASLDARDVPAFLHKLAAYDGVSGTKAALELLILTAVRPGELRGARWDEIDEANALWRIAAERMKMQTPHIVPLSKQALTLIKERRSTSTGDLLFPSPFYPGKPLSDGTLNSALARLGYKGMATAHGFRTLFSTCANEAGWNGDLIEKQLAHEERDEVRGAYNRAQYLPERVKLMQWWADRVDEMREIKQRKANTPRRMAA